MSPTITRLAAVMALAATTLATGLVGGLPSAQAATIVKPIVFPVDGTVRYTDDFGAARTGHTHEGNDLMGAKMMRELAAVDGTVLRVKFDNLSTGGNSVTIQAADGWTYHYIHVNNDTPGTDDGKATRTQAFPANIVPGATVHKGQVVAYMGDSGNAENVGPHLHFEIRQPAAAGEYQGAAIDPYESLQHAVRWSATPRWELRRTPTAGMYDDTMAYGVQVGDKPLLCDWDGDGIDEAVIYRQGTWHLRDGLTTGVTAAQLPFGTASDTPLCGNVDGDAADEPILFHAGTWTVRGGFGGADLVAWTVTYGVTAGDVPVVGDWNGDGKDDLAIFRVGGTWHIRSSAAVSGTTVGTFVYGRQVGDRPVSGDWDGNGKDDAAIYRNGQWNLRTNSQVEGATARIFTFGGGTDQPVGGRWVAGTTSGIGVLRPASG
jgi:hypothetical protein